MHASSTTTKRSAELTGCAVYCRPRSLQAAGRGHNPRESLKEAGLEKIDVTKDEVLGELLKDVAADETTSNSLKGVAEEASLEGTCETEEKLREAAVQKDVTADEAAEHDLRDTSAPEDVATNVPYRRNKRSEKKTKRGEGSQDDQDRVAHQSVDHVNMKK